MDTTSVNAQNYQGIESLNVPKAKPANQESDTTRVLKEASKPKENDPLKVQDKVTLSSNQPKAQELTYSKPQAKVESK